MACFHIPDRVFLQPCPPAKAVIAALGILFAVRAILMLLYTFPCDTQVSQAVKDTYTNHDALVDLLESIDHLLIRADIYTRVPPTPAMDEMMFNIMVELLSTLALATKELKLGRSRGSIFVEVLHLLNAAQ